MTREQIIEVMLKAWAEESGSPVKWMASALTALETALPGLADVISGKAVVVQVEPSEAMHSGLARDLIMWHDMHPKTPRALFRHLEMLRRPIPDWLRNEPEMRALDHVPSKATRAALIYRAMVEEARKAGE